MYKITNNEKIKKLNVADRKSLIKEKLSAIFEFYTTHIKQKNNSAR